MAKTSAYLQGENNQHQPTPKKKSDGHFKDLISIDG